MTDLDSGADLHALIDRALAELPVPTDDLRHGAVRKGRAVRRRRRALAAVGTVAAATVAGLIVVPSLSGSGPTPGQVAHDSTPTHTSADRPAGWWDMPGRVMQRRLDALMPAGLTITDANLGNEELAPGEKPRGGWLQVDLVDHGVPAGGANVILYPPVDDDGAFVRSRTTCPGDLTNPDTCTVVRDSAGSVVGRVSRSVSPNGLINAEVTRLTPEGAVVYTAMSNSSDDKWGLESSIDRKSPPLSMAQLTNLAENGSWRDWQPRS